MASLLTRAWLEEHRKSEGLPLYPERVIQFGEGKFMRGFVDRLFHRLNQGGLFGGSVVVVTPLASGAKKIKEINDQDGLYTVWLRGNENAQVIDQAESVQSIARAVDPYANWQEILRCAENRTIDIMVSNTTEAGIVYEKESYEPDRCPASFPAKVTAYLYARYQAFDGDPQTGMMIIPCELLEQNGDRLREIVLRYAQEWQLPAGFIAYVKEANHFYNTLVDSIVTAFQSPGSADLPSSVTYEDKNGILREPFYLWVIEGDEQITAKLPFSQLGLRVRYVADVTPFRQIKVRILNGAHTSLAGLATLAGLETVREAIQHPVLGTFTKHLLEQEVHVSLQNSKLAPSDVVNFTNDVIERFTNPLLHHAIASLQLNMLAKLRERVLPSILSYYQLQNRLPAHLMLAFAGQLLFTHPATQAMRSVAWRDDVGKQDRLKEAWELEHQEGLRRSVQTICSDLAFWGEDLSQIPGFVDHVTFDLEQLRRHGVVATIQQYV